MSNFCFTEIIRNDIRSSTLMIWGATRPSSKKLFASFSNSPGETTSRHLLERHHSRHVCPEMPRLDGGCWDASRACDHYDAGGAIPNFIVLGLADVNQDPCSWMDLSWCDIWDSTCCKGFWWFLATSGYNINRDMSDMIITNCKIMQASNLVVLEQKAKLYDSMMSQCVSVITNPCEVHFSQVAFWGTMFNFFITVAPSLVMVVPLPSSINLSIPRGPKVDLTMPTTW